MVRPTIRLAGLALTTLLIATPAARASTHVFIGVGVGVPAPVAVAPLPPPPPAAVVAAPAPYGYVWRPGYYVWTGYAYQMVPGAWVAPPYAGAVWVAPHWAAGPRGAYYARGYWHRH